MYKVNLFPGLVILILTGCTSLKPVSELSGKSVKSLSIYEEIPVTYHQFCEERCQFNLVRRNQIVRDSAANCDCALFATADKSTTKVYQALAAYFKTLGDISEGDLTNYDTKSLSVALTEGKFGSLTIDKNTVTAYSALGRLVMQAFTDGYRKKKIKEVIENGNPHIQVLLQVFETSVANLVSELNFEKERQFALHAELMMEKLTGYDKVSLAREYYKSLDAISARQDQLKTFSKGLRTIAEGHQKLYDNRNKIQLKEIRAILGDYSASLQDLIVDFKKL